MENEVLRALFQRRSHRAFSPVQLSDQELDALVQSGMTSPSANNHQPWHFSVVQNQGLLDDISAESARIAMTQPEDTRNPRFNAPSFHVFYHAPTVVFISSDSALPLKAIDCGIAVQSIALAAESMGLGSVILGLPRLAFEGGARNRLEKALDIPEGYSFTIAIAIGHPLDRKEPPEHKPGKVSYIR